MKKILIFISLLFLISCSATQSERNDMMRMSAQQLCMDYMTLPTVNRLQNDREEIIKLRKINCWQYGNVAAERRKADADFRDFRSIQPETKPRTKTQCVKTGDVINCTTY